MTDTEPGEEGGSESTEPASPREAADSLRDHLAGRVEAPAEQDVQAARVREQERTGSGPETDSHARESQLKSTQSGNTESVNNQSESPQSENTRSESSRSENTRSENTDLAEANNQDGDRSE
ncbi:MAG: hypothetical protein ABEJ71_01560 [Halodesulfurarchaeum sp.]